MTCIVGMASEKGTVIGGDSAGLAGWHMTLRKDPKVFLVDGVAFGFTTSFRMGQLLQHSFLIPCIDGQELFQYMCTDFIDGVRKCLKDGGFTEIKDNHEEGGAFLVGIGGRLFVINPDFQVGESLDGYSAIGCGAEFALGSLCATEDRDYKAATRMTLSLNAAEKFSGGVKGPFNIVVAER